MFDPTGHETLIASGFTKAGGLVIQPVPEPSALVLLGLGAVAAIGWRQRARG